MRTRQHPFQRALLVLAFLLTLLVYVGLVEEPREANVDLRVEWREVECFAGCPSWCRIPVPVYVH